MQQFKNLERNDLNVVVFNFIDMLSHARTESKMVRELANDEKAYRALTLNWFRHSVMAELFRMIAQAGYKTVITTDHGSIRANRPVKIIGDRNTNTNLRYKLGKNLSYNQKDLADIIATYEQLGKPVNRDLFAQFLKDEDIADQFAVYYTLFEKYRSDYQVGKILSGYATDAIRKRAKEAEFDERVALLSLLLDAIAGECAKALDQESLVLDLRDVLREVKPELLDGKTVDETLHPRIERRELELARRMDAGIASKAFVRKERLVIGKLRAFAAQCTAEKTPGGDTAFHTLERCYKAEVDKIKPLVDAANEKIDNAFDFVDDCFANREMLVFLAELTTRQTTTNFISHYGNEKYYAHNDELQVDQTRTSLSARIKGLDEDDIVRPIDEVSQSHITSVDMSGAVGFRGGDAQTPVKAEGEITDAELAEYYSGKQFEYGFASMSKMNLLAHTIKGKRVLDVCCRRGKGVYKFSAKIAPGGHVIGTDWNPDYVDDAIAGMDRAWHDNGLKENNMEFRVAFPEKLIDAGIGDGTMEVVYINNVMTLLYDQERALQEFARVLKPGGLLLIPTYVAQENARATAVTTVFRAMGTQFPRQFSRESYRQFFEDRGIAAEYRMVRGLVPCCVAVIRVEK